jgi:hypothetical protein
MPRGRPSHSREKNFYFIYEISDFIKDGEFLDFAIILDNRRMNSYVEIPH